jgi:hypothetical protein
MNGVKKTVDKKKKTPPPYLKTGLYVRFLVSPAWSMGERFSIDLSHVERIPKQVNCCSLQT